MHFFKSPTSDNHTLTEFFTYSQFLNRYLAKYSLIGPTTSNPQGPGTIRRMFSLCFHLLPIYETLRTFPIQ